MAPYAEGDFSLLDDTLHIVPGVRFEPYITSTNKLTPPPAGSPNIGYTHEEARHRAAHLGALRRHAAHHRARRAFGIYHQAPQPEDLSAVFGTPTLALSTAQHYLAGGSVPARPSRSRSR